MFKLKYNCKLVAPISSSTSPFMRVNNYSNMFMLLCLHFFRKQFTKFFFKNENGKFLLFLRAFRANFVRTSQSLFYIGLFFLAYFHKCMFSFLYIFDSMPFLPRFSSFHTYIIYISCAVKFCFWQISIVHFIIYIFDCIYTHIHIYRCTCGCEKSPKSTHHYANKKKRS